MRKSTFKVNFLRTATKLSFASLRVYICWRAKEENKNERGQRTIQALTYL